MKEQVASAIAARVSDGDVLGVGSGSTTELALKAIGRRIKEEKLKIRALATSHRSAQLALASGLELVDPLAEIKLSWAFDGADEVDPELNLIKGRGAAMLSEKIIARRTPRFVVIVTAEKLVRTLGERCAVPVEIIPAALRLVERELRALGAGRVELREASNKYGPVVTEHGNLVLDARFGAITPALDSQLSTIPGVVEHGLFFGYTSEVLVADKKGVFSLAAGDKPAERKYLQEIG